jgi:hypothetical protein
MIHFTKEEDKLIINTVNDFMQQEKTMKEAYRHLSDNEITEKSIDAIKKRHMMLRKADAGDGEGEEQEDGRRTYTDEEDAIVYTRLSAAKAAGIDLKVAYAAVGDELGRPPGSVSNRYNRIKTKM